MSSKHDDDGFGGRQILPVAFKLPEDGIPTDGMEYLLAVRRNARSLPHITRVPNPYEIPERPPTPSDPLPPPAAAGIPLPTKEWRALYESRFRNFRKNLAQPTTHVQSPTGNRRLFPDIEKRDLWWAFLSGRPIEEWDPPKKSKNKPQRGMRAFADEPSTVEQAPAPPSIGNEPSSPIEPTPTLLLRIDHRMALHLLMYFTHWSSAHVQKRHRVTKTHARWVFALLARVDENLSGDEMHLLRNLARAYLALLKGLAEGDHDVDAGSCWLVICAVVGVWGQRDLWSDAEEMVARR